MAKFVLIVLVKEESSTKENLVHYYCRSVKLIDSSICCTNILYIVGVIFYSKFE